MAHNTWTSGGNGATAIDIDNGILNPLLKENERDETGNADVDSTEESPSIFTRLLVGTVSLLLGVTCGVIVTLAIDNTFMALGLTLPCGGLVNAASRGMQRMMTWPSGGGYEDAYARELLLRGISVNAVADSRQALMNMADMAEWGKDAASASLLTQQRWIDAHNHFRNQHYNSSFNLIWDNEVAKEAQSWADQLKESSKCEARYSLREGMGENMYWGAFGAGQPPFLPWEVVSAWAGQKDFYDYENNTCEQGMECSSYLQVIWKETTRFGCGQASCDYSGVFKGTQTVLLCYYLPGAPFNAPQLSVRPF